MEYLSREQAIEKAGFDAVHFVDSINCEMTGRVMDVVNVVEFSATVDLTDSDFETLTVYYYQNEEYIKMLEDLGDADWEPFGYRVE